MTIYPQLQTGSRAQFGFWKSRQYRTIANRTAGLNEIVSADAEASAVEWHLYYRGLSAAEMASIEATFEECRGPLRPMLFLDPSANLLRWSEDLLQPVWARGPMLEVSAGGSGPEGGAAFLLLNAGGGASGLSQTLEVPAACHTCFSLYVRGTAPVTLRRSAGAVSSSKTFAAGPEWRRVQTGGGLSSAEETSQFTIEVPAGGQVQVFGPQVDAQPAAAEYRRAEASCGIHSSARFAQDELRAVIEGPDWCDVEVRVRSQAGS